MYIRQCRELKVDGKMKSGVLPNTVRYRLSDVARIGSCFHVSEMIANVCIGIL